MPRRSSSHARYVFALGAAITAAVVGLHTFGALDGWERLTWDLRFKHARLRPTPMADAIRHVDIDDGAINTVGRWPWPRTRIAMALEEIARAGARVIALDLLFDDPDTPSWEPAEDAAAPASPESEPQRFVRLDHDAALAEAFAKAPATLALNLGKVDSLGRAWREASGGRELDALLDALAKDISSPEEDAAASAGLTGERRKQFTLAPGVFRLLAATREASALLETNPSATFEDLVRRVAPKVDERTGAFPELPTLRRAWDQSRSWQALRPSLREARYGAPTRPDPDDRAPIAHFTRTTAAPGAARGAAGFVDFVADPDGGVREVSAVRDAATGESIQFGIAAAARYLGVAPGEVGVGPDAVRVGSVSLPRMPSGRVLLDYPKAAGGWLDALKRKPEQPIGFGHVSIGALIDLARQRSLLVGNRMRLEAVTRLCLGLAPDAPVGAAEIADALDQGKDRTRELRALLDSGEALDQEERHTLEAFTQQALLEEEVRLGPERLKGAEATLRELLADRLVFVGWSSTGALADFVMTPLGSRTPGVIVHAVAADMVLSNRAVAPSPVWLAPAMALLLGLTASLLVARATPVPSAISSGAIALGYAGVGGVLLFNWWPLGSAPQGVGMMFPLISPLLAMAASFFGCTMLEAALSRHDRLRIERQFKARVSGQLVDFLVENPGALSMSGQQREITTVFIDLAGFTAISERLDGPTTVATLNRCMREMTTALTAEGAYVNKFLGDGLMAFWSAFVEDPDQASRACRAAVACQKAVEALNSDPSMQGLPHLSARIGVATGAVVVGDCGAPPELNDYTVIGNEVNLAARLESANKQFGTSVLIDGRTRELLGAAAPGGAASEGFRLRPLGRIIVVGQTRPVAVFEILPPDADQARIELTVKAVERSHARDAAGAAVAWNDLAARFGDKKLAEAYLEGEIETPEGDASRAALRLKAK